MLGMNLAWKAIKITIDKAIEEQDLMIGHDIQGKHQD